jgi:hypothetical protein
MGFASAAATRGGLGDAGVGAPVAATIACGNMKAPVGSYLAFTASSVVNAAHHAVRNVSAAGCWEGVGQNTSRNALNALVRWMNALPSSGYSLMTPP